MLVQGHRASGRLTWGEWGDLGKCRAHSQPCAALQEDLSFAGYQKHLSSCAAPAPLTSAERELQQIRINEVGFGAGTPPAGQARGLAHCRHPQVKTEISVESKHQTLQGLAFPLQPAAQRALQQLQQRTVNYIQLVGTARPQLLAPALPEHCVPRAPPAPCRFLVGCPYCAQCLPPSPAEPCHLWGCREHHPSPPATLECPCAALVHADPHPKSWTSSGRVPLQ